MHLVKHLQKRLVKEEKEIEFTLANSGLVEDQIEMVGWVVRCLRMEEKTGRLSRQDIMRMCYGVGLNPTDDAVESKLRSMKIAKCMTFTIEQFAHLWHNLLCDGMDEKETLERAFYFFDRDGNGEISIMELKTTMRELGDLLSEEEIQQFCTLMDKNNDGVIEYSEFISMLQSQVSAQMVPKCAEWDSKLDKPCYGANIVIPPGHLGAPDPENDPNDCLCEGIGCTSRNCLDPSGVAEPMCSSDGMQYPIRNPDVVE